MEIRCFNLAVFVLSMLSLLPAFRLLPFHAFSCYQHDYRQRLPTERVVLSLAALRI